VTASLQSLKTLKVRGCKHLTMHAVRSIINNVPYLEVGERGRETSHRQSPTDHHRACVDKWSRDVVAHADAGVFLRAVQKLDAVACYRIQGMEAAGQMVRSMMCLKEVLTNDVILSGAQSVQGLRNRIVR